MALSFLDNIDYRGKKPTTTREYIEKISDFAGLNENYYPDVFVAVCAEDESQWMFRRSNEVTETGRWRKLEGSGGSAELETSATAAIDVGGIVKGKEYIAGTPLEDILRDLVFGGSSHITLNTCFNGILSSPADINETAILGLTKGEFGNTFEYVYNAEGQIMVAVFPRDLNIVIKNSMFTLNWNSVDMLIGGLPFTCYYSNILKVTDYKVTFITE